MDMDFLEAMERNSHDEEEDDADVIAEREAILAESNEVTFENEEVDEFLVQLTEAKKLLQRKGKNAGLCDKCLGTGVLVSQKEEYSGLSYRVDNELPQFLTCHCGTFDDKSLAF